MSISIVSVASIQRYILIFYAYLMNSHVKHYTPIILPTILSSSSSILYWLSSIRVKNNLIILNLGVFGPCYLFRSTLATVDWILFSFVPTFLTVIFSSFQQSCRIRTTSASTHDNYYKTNELVGMLKITLVEFSCERPKENIFGHWRYPHCTIKCKILWFFSYRSTVVLSIRPYDTRTCIATSTTELS